MENKCIQCSAPAEVKVSWVISLGPQEGLFCSECARQMFYMFKNTAAGQSMVFSDHLTRTTEVLYASEKGEAR